MENEELNKKIGELSSKIDKYHNEEKEKADLKWWLNVSLISLGFGLAIFNTWLNSSDQRCVNLIIAVVLFCIAIGALGYSSRFKEK